MVLLASARNLVTKGTKPRLAHRIFEHEHEGTHVSQTVASSEAESQPGNNPTTPTRSQARSSEQPSTSQFSSAQRSQLRELISEAVVSQQASHFQSTNSLHAVPPLFPVSVSNSAANLANPGQTTRTEIQDGGLSAQQLEPSLPQVQQSTTPSNALLLQVALSAGPYSADLSSTVRLSHHLITMTQEARRDIAWWIDFFPTWNGRAIIPDP